jgi:hypothetical protein
MMRGNKSNNSTHTLSDIYAVHCERHWGNCLKYGQMDQYVLDKYLLDVYQGYIDTFHHTVRRAFWLCSVLYIQAATRSVIHFVFRHVTNSRHTTSAPARAPLMTTVSQKKGLPRGGMIQSHAIPDSLGHHSSASSSTTRLSGDTSRSQNMRFSVPRPSCGISTIDTPSLVETPPKRYAQRSTDGLTLQHSLY